MPIRVSGGAAFGAISFGAALAVWLGFGDVYSLKHHGERQRSELGVRASTAAERLPLETPTGLLSLSARSTFPATWAPSSSSSAGYVLTTSLAPQSTLSTPAGLRAPPHFDRGIYTALHGEKFYDISEFVGLLPEGNWSVMVPLIKKLASGDNIKIFVLGGSFSAGVDCLQPAQGTSLSRRLCAWPARFLHWMRIAFPQSRVQMENHAQGGSPSNVILAGLGLLNFKGVDLILVETLVNDWGDEIRGYEREFRLDKKIAVSSSFEVLLRTLKKVAPRSLIYTVEAACPGCRTAIANHKNVLDFYGIPHLDMVKVVQEAPNSTLWVGRNHPSYQTHQALADLLALSWNSAPSWPLA